MHYSQRLLLGPSANQVFAQERQEGNFRTELMRLRHLRTEIAANRSEKAERGYLEIPFLSVLFYQWRVTLWNASISFVTQASLIFFFISERFAVFELFGIFGQLPLYRARFVLR